MKVQMKTRSALELSRMTCIRNVLLDEELRMRRVVHRILFFLMGEHLMTPVVNVVQSVTDATGGYFFQTLDAGQYKGHFGEDQSLTTQYREELKTHRH